MTDNSGRVVLIAPDCFGGTLTANEAAEAIAEGWRRGSPADQLLLRPLADGGPGFVDVLHTALGGELHTVEVTGPRGEPVTAVWLAHEGTAYIESAQAAGLHLVPKAERAAGAATTRGVGELLLDAVRAGMRTAVVGLGGSATTDGGAGLFAALGAGPVDALGAPLPDGGAALVDCAGLAGRPDLGELRLVAASDVDNPLLGPTGAAHVFGPQKGASPEEVEQLDQALTRWSEVLLEELDADVAGLAGAGAAGGLGGALLALGATVDSGADLVRRLSQLDAALDSAGLVLTGEGSFDWQSLRGKLVSRVAAGAAERGVPCLVLAGQVSVGRREAGAAGVEESYSVTEHVGSVAEAMAEPAGGLSGLAERVAGQWRSPQN
ncbi:glycerate kinase [Crossiella sp. CA-258035]|uniref:glycerate kinase family protein n=1 Tax=Crossiella sp. CA-258035 TaxID=2981138 RepID=UPI0024BC4742|nr:glycerate kinase [Crossiella sp. CA-258035]WHT21219.1 glycerate kinase [Crossiella sp. CA-258035]